MSAWAAEHRTTRSEERRPAACGVGGGAVGRAVEESSGRRRSACDAIIKGPATMAMRRPRGMMVWLWRRAQRE